MMTNATFTSFLIAALLILASCSETTTGSGESTDDNGAVNDGDDTAASVTADAGSPADAVVGFEVTADGSESTGSSTVAYSWTISGQPANSQASLNGSSSDSPTFTPDLPGEYTLTLEATSDGESDTDTVVFSAIAKRVFVDANNGADGETDGYMPGTPAKSVTRALSLYALNESDPFHAIDTIRVAEGEYDQANGESFPLDFSGELIVKGDQDVDRNKIHLFSPDVDRIPTVKLGEGVTLRHLHIENGYTGGTFNGDPDAVYVKSGSSPETSTVTLEDVTLRTNNREGFIISTGSSINVYVRGEGESRSLIDGKDIGRAYTNRFNTSNTRVEIRDTDVINMGRNSAFDIDDANNVNLVVRNTTVQPSVSVSEPQTAFQLNSDYCSITLDSVTVTSSDGTPNGRRYQRAIDMDADQPNSIIDVMNSTLQYTSLSTIEMYAASVYITDSVIEGTNMESYPDDINYLSRDGIRQLDGALKVRGTTFRNIFGNAVAVGGPVSPNANDFSVDLGTSDDPGENTFTTIYGWDLDLSRGDGDVSGEIPAIGNAWSNSASPRCGQDRSQPEDAEIQVSYAGNSVQWGTGTGEVCN